MVSPDRLLAMEQAIKEGNLKKVRLMLKAGVPANHVFYPSLGWSFGNLAARMGDFEIFCCLIEAGADIRFRGEPGNSMLKEAACSPTASMEIVNKVLAESEYSQADLDEVLRYAPEHGNLELVNRLLEVGANPKYVDDDRASALLYAVMCDQPAIAVRLVQAGADPKVRSSFEEFYKKTVLEIAQLKEMQAVVEAINAELKDAATPVAQVAPSHEFHSIGECLTAISQWLVTHDGVELGAPLPNPALPQTLGDAPHAADLLAVFQTHNGSNGECVIPMATDVPYELLTWDDALDQRELLIDLFEAEGQLSAMQATLGNGAWLPLASNGAGDLLIWNAETGQIQHFSHETWQAVPRADSLFQLFHDIAQGLHSGKYFYNPEHGIA